MPRVQGRPRGRDVSCSTRCHMLREVALDVETLQSLATEWIAFRDRLVVAVETFELSTSDPTDEEHIMKIRSATARYDKVLRSICLPLDHDRWPAP